MNNPSRYDGRHPEPPYPTEPELAEADAEIADLRQQLAYHESAFKIRWDANQRAIKRWQEAHPQRGSIWPDHADLCVWLMGQLEAERQRADRAEAGTKAAVEAEFDRMLAEQTKHVEAAFRAGQAEERERREKAEVRIEALEEAAGQAWTCLLTGNKREATIDGLRAVLSAPAQQNLGRSEVPSSTD